MNTTRQRPPLDFNQLSKTCFENSARWFPDLHTTPIRAAMHFVVGFTGEFGEFLDASESEMPEELADCFIYLLDLAGAFHVALSSSLIDTMSMGVAITPRSMWLDLGVIANCIKKQNRKNLLEPDTAIADAIHTLLARLVAIAVSLDIDIQAEIERKIAICNDRWGWPGPRDLCPTTLCGAVLEVVRTGDTPGDTLGRIRKRWPGTYPYVSTLDVADVFGELRGH